MWAGAQCQGKSIRRGPGALAARHLAGQEGVGISGELFLAVEQRSPDLRGGAPSSRPRLRLATGPICAPGCSGWAGWSGWRSLAKPLAIKQAGFPVIKTLDQFKVQLSSAPQATFDYLALLEWLRARENPYCSVPPAPVSRICSSAFGYATVSAGHGVRYFTTAELVETLCRGLADNFVGRVIDNLLCLPGRLLAGRAEVDPNSGVRLAPSDRTLCERSSRIRPGRRSQRQPENVVDPFRVGVDHLQASGQIPDRARKFRITPASWHAEQLQWTAGGTSLRSTTMRPGHALRPGLR